MPPHDVLFSEAEIARRIAQMAAELAPSVDDDWLVVALLQGAGPFAADLMRALASLGRHPIQDALWLESYRDARESAGRVSVRADLARSVSGRCALILDDVFDSGRTLAYARAHLLAKGARAVETAAMVRKPQALSEPIGHVGFDAPDQFLIGYGMDDAGRYRGLPYIAAVR